MQSPQPNSTRTIETFPRYGGNLQNKRSRLRRSERAGSGGGGNRARDEKSAAAKNRASPERPAFSRSEFERPSRLHRHRLSIPGVSNERPVPTLRYTGRRPFDAKIPVWFARSTDLLFYFLSCAYVSVRFCAVLFFSSVRLYLFKRSVNSRLGRPAGPPELFPSRIPGRKVT